jgi:hypothetical protein
MKICIVILTIYASESSDFSREWDLSFTFAGFPWVVKKNSPPLNYFFPLNLLHSFLGNEWVDMLKPTSIMTAEHTIGKITQLYKIPNQTHCAQQALKYKRAAAKKLF